jgi:Trk K+ transport system NAD-binding subunit
MLERQIIGTIPVHRSLALVADVSIAPGSLLEGSRLNDAYVPGESRVLAIRRRGCADFDWDPQGGYILVQGDSIVVVATRKGLSRLHARSVARPFPSREDPAASTKRSGWFDTIKRRGSLRQNKR